MACSTLRSIYRKAAAANSPNYSLLRGVMINGGKGGAAPRTMSVVSYGNFNSTTTTSPWLMLPPTFEGDDIVYNFYSLAENKVLNLSTGSKSSLGLAVGDDVKFGAPCHGWLTLFNRRNCDLFLCNPLSGRHIKLPPIHTLPIPKENLRGGFGCVTKVITSCSPEQQDCRVMMSFGTENRIAFCSPTTSTEWTPIGDLYHEDLTARSYEDFICFSRHKLFFCITQQEDGEAWDLQDIGSPLVFPDDLFLEEENYPWAARSEEELELKMLCRPLQFLAADEFGNIYFVRRYVVDCMAPDGSYVDYDLDKEAASKLPYKTIGFDVYKYDLAKNAFVYMDGSLDGFALFIGNNHSFAVSTKREAFSELKPNSIYFTDTHEFIRPKRRICVPYGGHDLGIFNYEDRTFSPCYYPCDRQSVQRIIPAPIWFTPTPL